MFDRLLNLWDRLRTSLWLVPMLFLGVAVALRAVAFHVDARYSAEEALRTWWLYGGSGDDARNLLSTLVTALITMASVMFSITMVVLSLAANQFGSRLIRMYVADLRTQVALGVFLMAILYCLLVLRTVEHSMAPGDVPHVAVSLGLLLALLCIGVLLLFLHVVARSIVADNVVRRLGADLEKATERLMPAEGQPDAARPDAVQPAELPGSATVVRARREGYVQAVEYEQLAEEAARRDAVVVLHCRAGAFMCLDGWLASVHTTDAVDDEFADAVRDQVLIGPQRTPVQDIEFVIRQLVDVALRALSPGVNDPNTATVVVDRLRGALARIMGKQLARPAHVDGSGRVRVLGETSTIEGVFDAAFNQIRQAGASQPAVAIHMLGAIGRLAEHVRTVEQARALRRHAGMIARAALSAASEPQDRADVDRASSYAERRLDEACPGTAPSTPHGAGPRVAVRREPA